VRQACWLQCVHRVRKHELLALSEKRFQSVLYLKRPVRKRWKLSFLLWMQPCQRLPGARGHEAALCTQARLRGRCCLRCWARWVNVEHAQHNAVCGGGTAVAVNGRARWVGVVAVGQGRCAFAQAGARALASDFCDKCAAYLQSLYNAIDYAIETCYQLH
jgi:hypothetical protein